MSFEAIADDTQLTSKDHNNKSTIITLATREGSNELFIHIISPALSDALFVLLLNVQVNSYGHGGTVFVRCIEQCCGYQTEFNK